MRDRNQLTARLVGQVLLLSSFVGILSGSLIAILAAPTSGWWLAGSSLVAVGSAIFGSCFSLVIGRWAGVDTLKSLDRVLESHISSLVDDPYQAILSAPERLEPFRRALHYYQATIIDGQLVWRYKIYQFESCAVGAHELRTVYETFDPRNGRRHRHDARLAVRDSRIVMVRRRLSGEEPPVVAIFPLGAQGFRHCSAGIAHLQNWDGEHMTIPCLLAMGPVIRAEEGTVDAVCFKELEKKWRSEYRGIRVHLPAETSSQA